MAALHAGKAVTIAPQSMTLTTQQAADLLGVSRPTVVRLIKSGELAAERIGNRHRLVLDDVLAYREVGYSVERENLPADDPVRNGNRWRVIAVDTEHHRIAARRLGDGARAAFSGDYLHEHITHGYAITVHASQGTTAHSTHAVLGDNTSRATLYVAMTPARESNTAYLCERTAGEGARVDLAGWDLWVSGKAEAMSDEKSASPVWCRVGARCDHRGKRSCW